MPTSVHPLLSVTACVVLSIVAAPACTSPSEAKPDPFVIALGDSATGQVAAGDTLTYRFDGAPGEQLAIALSSPDADISVRVHYPTGTLAGFLLYLGSVEPLATPPISLVLSTMVPGTYRARVFAEHTSGGRFAFWPVRLNPAPEHAAAGIVLNTIISDETLARPVDIDDFTFDATAGQEITLALQRSGSSDGALFGRLFLFSASPLSLPVATVFASTASDDLAARAVRVTVPTTGRYRLRIGGQQFEQAWLYDGPYRFHVSVLN